MSFFGSFFGSDQKKDVTAAYNRATPLLNEGIERARTATTGAIDRVEPWAAGGRDANAMYANAIGLNGRPAQQGVVDNFMIDPFRQQNEDLANENLARQFNGRGPGLNSGAFALATARGNLERGSHDWNTWLDRIHGVSTEGLGAATTQAGLGGQLGAIEMEGGNARAANEINYGNAMAATRGIGINNLLGLGGTLVRAATPGYQGQTAAGNLWGGLTNVWNGAGNAVGNGWNAMANWGQPQQTPGAFAGRAPGGGFF